MVTYEQIQSLIKLKKSVIPSGGGPTKKAPLVEWTEYQTRLPTEAELILWHGNGLHPTLWGIVTGEISGVVVFDTDSSEAMEVFHKADLKPHVKTRRGEHYYFKWPGHKLNNQVGILPHIDLRGDGGFVNCLGSNDNASYEMLILPTEETLYDFQQLPYDVKMALLKPAASQPQKSFTDVGEKIPQGNQNKWLFNRARGYYTMGDTEEMIVEKLKIDALRCDQDMSNPFTDKDFIKIAKSAVKYVTVDPLIEYAEEHIQSLNTSNSILKRGILKGENTPLCRNAETNPLQPVTPVTKRYETLSRDLIKQYLVDGCGKWIFIRDLDNDLGVKTPEQKNARRQAIFQMVKAGLVERDPILDNKIRFINSSAGKITLSLANLGTPMPIRYPFQLQNKVDIYPKNIILVAGAMNSGKTALLLNIARMNMDNFNIVYFSSEMADQELVNRIMRFNEGSEDLEHWQNRVDFRERSHDFADVIRPDDFNIIDYVELNENIYLIGGMLEAIYNRLNKGVAVVAIQKKVGALFGRGQEFSAEKPRLYLSMDAGKLTIVKGKNWHNKNDNPNRQYIRFKLVNGCEFIQEGKWQKMEDC